MVTSNHIFSKMLNKFLGLPILNSILLHDTSPKRAKEAKVYWVRPA